jgi:hypothetical protein
VTLLGPSRTHTVKAAVTLAGALVSIYAGFLGRQIEQFSDAAAEGTTEPASDVPEGLNAVRKQLKLLQ